MAILIVDDEENTRMVLHEFLIQLGLGPILEASGGEEAHRIIDAEKGQLRMIISDWEMPRGDGFSILDFIARDPDLDLTPFVLITSDPTAPRPARLDACLAKPFQISALNRTLAEAQAHRREARDLLLYYGTRQVTGFKEAMQSGHDTHWRECVGAGTSDELRAMIEKHRRRIGAILIESESYESGSDWLEEFRKSSIGMATYTVCLAKTPEAGLNLRASCDFFLMGRVSFQRWHWLIERMSKISRASWAMDQLAAQCRSALKTGSHKAILKAAQKILEIDSGNENALEWVALVLAAAGERSRSIDRLREILENNPYSASAYLKLMELMKSDSPLGRQALAKKAARLCPDRVDVLLSVAKILSATGAAGELPPILEKILVLDPGNAEAIKLISS